MILKIRRNPSPVNQAVFPHEMMVFSGHESKSTHPNCLPGQKCQSHARHWGSTFRPT
jgi:hypothetical protein